MSISFGIATSCRRLDANTGQPRPNVHRHECLCHSNQAVTSQAVASDASFAG